MWLGWSGAAVAVRALRTIAPRGRSILVVFMILILQPGGAVHGGVRRTGGKGYCPRAEIPGNIGWNEAFIRPGTKLGATLMGATDDADFH